MNTNDKLRIILGENNADHLACFSCEKYGKKHNPCGIIHCTSVIGKGEWICEIYVIDNEDFKKDLEAQFRETKTNIVISSPTYPGIQIVMPKYTRITIQHVNQMFEDVRQLLNREATLDITVKPNPTRS